MLHRTSIQHAADIIQRALAELTEWGLTAGLKFSPQKTVAIIFTRANKLILPRKLRMNNEEIEYTTEVKYLGVHLDSKLSWSTHLSLIHI